MSGIYGSPYQGDNDFAAIRGNVEAFAREEGRRPRILVARIRQDGPHGSPCLGECRPGHEFSPGSLDPGMRQLHFPLFVIPR